MENIKRLDYLDVSKGIGILLVVLGHIYTMRPGINRSIPTVWIYSFHMPLFFIVSGILVKFTENKWTEQSFWQIFKSKFKRLMIPYFLFGMVSIILRCFLRGVSISNILWDAIYLFVLYGIEALWFLPALFIGEIMLIFMLKAIKNKMATILLVLGLFSFAIFIRDIDYNMILLILSRAFIALGFISVGYYSFNIINNTDMNVIYLLISFIINIFIAQYNGYVDLNNLVLNNVFLYVLNAILGSFIVILACKKTNIAFIKYLGQSSLIIMALHQNIMYLFEKITGLSLYGYITGLILFTILTIIHITIIQLINNYLPWMIGKFKKKEKYIEEIAIT